MTLKDYAAHLGGLLTAEIPPEADRIEISGVENNSARVVPGSLFCAIAGSKTDGHRFLPDAVRRGAAALVVHESYSGILPEHPAVLRVRDSYFAWGCLCELARGIPAAKMQLHTVTGTNGNPRSCLRIKSLQTCSAMKRSSL